MKSSNTIICIALGLVYLYLSGCASHMIEVRPGSVNVNLQSSNNVISCKPMGKVTVSVMTEFGFYTRSADDVESNLVQMARNSAIDSGADTIVKEEMTEYGRRTFATYKCQR